MNDAFFMMILWAGRLLLTTLGFEPEHGQLLARIIVASVLGVVLLLLSRSQIRDTSDLCCRSLILSPWNKPARCHRPTSRPNVLRRRRRFAVC